MNAPKGPADMPRKSPGRTRPCHATSPCLANTRRILHLISRPPRDSIPARVLHCKQYRRGIASPADTFSIGLATGAEAPAGSATYLMILDTTPAPTVRPPSRIAKRRPSSIATGLISVTTIFTLSPGITISTPSGSCTAPVMSVVRK